MPRENIGASRPDRDDTQTSRRRRTAVGALATITGLLTCAVAVQPARAGTYVMRNCNVPGHSNTLLAPWQALDIMGPNLSIANDCASGGGVSVTIGDVRQMGGGTAGGIVVFRPSGQRRRITFVKLVLWYSTRLSGSGQPIHFWSADWRTDGTYRWGLSNAPPGSESVVAEHQLSPDTEAVRLGIHCGPLGPPTPPDQCVAADSAPLLIRGMELTLSEDVLPIVARPMGSLLDGGPQSGVREVTYSAADPQSGLRQVEVLLGETVVADRDLSADCAYSDFTVCPPSADGAMQIDTRAVSNGPHRLTLRVLDAAGNLQEMHSDRPVEVFNEPTPTPAHAPVYTLSSRFAGTSRSTLTVPYGRRVSIRGRLLQAAKAPPVGSLIEVLERSDDRGGREVSSKRAKTKADGSFSVALVTTRPSRTVRLAYRSMANKKFVSRPLRLRVRSASRLRASLRGRLVRFSGRVLSGPIETGGKKILMEGRSPGSAWTRFKILRTDRKGQFSGTYRLRVRRPGVTLKIRAVLPHENGYGYLSSRSRAVSLRVR